jgi:hypothetical protein
MDNTLLRSNLLKELKLKTQSTNDEYIELEQDNTSYNLSNRNSLKNNLKSEVKIKRAKYSINNENIKPKIEIDLERNKKVIDPSTILPLRYIDQGKLNKKINNFNKNLIVLGCSLFISFAGLLALNDYIMNEYIED